MSIVSRHGSVEKRRIFDAIRASRSNADAAAKLGISSGALSTLRAYHGLERILFIHRTGGKGELDVRAWLRSRGLNPIRQAYWSPFDIECNGYRIEVKTAHRGSVENLELLRTPK